MKLHHRITNCSVPLALLFTASIAALEAQEQDYSTAAELGLMEGFPPPAEKRVNKSNALFAAPFNRWSYQNMRKVYPTAGIPTAQRPIPLDRAIDGRIEGLKVKNPKTGEKVDMETWLKETYTDAFTVVHGDKVVYERYLNGMTSDQPHQMMSVTKSFAGLFGLLAVDSGKAKESDLIATHLPELKDSSAFKGATFGHALNMTNSVDFTEDYADPESGIVHYATVLGFMAPVPGKEYAGSIYEFLPTLEAEDQKHGEIFHYQTPKTDVVNWITNRTTGQSFQDNLFEVLWSKLGTDGETYVLLDQNGTLFAGGGLNATPNDLARFGSMMVSGGKFNGQQVVSQEVIDKLATGADRKAFKDGPNGKGLMGDGNWSYRAQWWVRHTPEREAFTAMGIHGQWIYCDVERGVAIIKQSSQPVSADDYYDEYNLNAYDAIIGELTK